MGFFYRYQATCGEFGGEAQMRELGRVNEADAKQVWREIKEESRDTGGKQIDALKHRK